jgi:hypothetical protein
MFVPNLTSTRVFRHRRIVRNLPGVTPAAWSSLMKGVAELSLVKSQGDAMRKPRAKRRRSAALGSPIKRISLERAKPDAAIPRAKTVHCGDLIRRAFHRKREVVRPFRASSFFGRKPRASLCSALGYLIASRWDFFCEAYRNNSKKTPTSREVGVVNNLLLSLMSAGAA